MVGLSRFFAHFLKLRSYLYDTCMVLLLAMIYNAKGFHNDTIYNLFS